MIDASIFCQLVAENHSIFSSLSYVVMCLFFAVPLRSEACFRMIAGLHGTGFPQCSPSRRATYAEDCNPPGGYIEYEFHGSDNT